MVSQSHLILFLSLAFLFFSQVKPDLASEKSALLSLKSALGGGSKHLNKWTTNSSTPCSWVGVSCENNTVTSLRLPGAGLKGSIPTGVIGNLTHLRFLSLRFNSLTGQLPFDLSLCTELRGLYLHNNNFSGVIPSFLFGIRGLVRLNLARNNFAGIISPAISDLKRLRSLNLEVNKLSGSIPELELPNLVQFNVSHNNLKGPIPASLRSFKPSAFEGNSLCGAPLSPCP